MPRATFNHHSLVTRHIVAFAVKKQRHWGLIGRGAWLARSKFAAILCRLVCLFGARGRKWLATAERERRVVLHEPRATTASKLAMVQEELLFKPRASGLGALERPHLFISKKVVRQNKAIL